MKKFYSFYTFLFFLFFVYSTKVNACSPYGTPFVATQSISGGNLNIVWTSTTAWACSYNIRMEIVCNSAAFTGTTNYTSVCISKPTTANMNYPSWSIPLSAFCPGVTYKFRAIEVACGGFSGSGWSTTYTFTVPGTPPTLTASASPTTICPSETSTLTSTYIGGCGSPTYSWSPGGQTTPNISVSPVVTTTYTVTTQDGCVGSLSTSVTVTIPPPPVAGTASANPNPICSGQTTALSLVGYQGNIQWQSGPTSTGPWTNIAGAITTPYTTAAFVNSTTTPTSECFRAEVSGCGPTVYSNAICVTINPIPTVTAPSNIVVCNGGNIATSNYVGSVSGTTFAWTNSNTAIGLAANGTGNITSFTATNTTTAPILANITVTPTANGCTGPPSTYSITVNPTPTVVVPSNIVICDAAPTTTTNFTSPTTGATFAWTNSNTAIGLAANGTGNIASFTATNTTTAPILANITVTPSANSCLGTPSTYSITVNPTPTVVVPSNIVICDAATTTATTYTSPTTGATFAWTNDNTSIGLAANGTGNIASFTATNTTTAPIIANITVTPTANSCLGTPSTYSITVNPTPTVVVPSNIVICDAANTTVTNFTSPTTGTTFTWMNDNTSIGLAASGTGDITSFTTTNTTTAPIIANITVTPTANSCTGTPSTYSITVNPTPTVVVPSNIVICNGAITTSTTFTSPTAGTTFAWMNDNTAIGLAANGTGDITSFTATNTTTAPILANITVTPTANTCVGIPSTYSITVNPTPTVVVPLDTIVCDAATVSATNYTSPTTGTTFAWTNDNTTIGLSANGTGDITSFSATNTTTAPITANITVTPTANACVGTPSTYTITVHPLPTPNFTFPNVCFGTTSSFTDLSNANGGVLTNWNWDFTNNGSVDNITPNPFNGYPAAGSYTVELMVQTALGCKDSIIKTVTVNPIPLANFSAPDVCLNTITPFTDSSTVATGSIATFQWDFADGVGLSAFQSPSYLYTNFGVYNVSLTVTSDSNCINTIVIPVTVFNNPIAAFTTTDVCQNVTAMFTDQSNGNGGTIDQYEWDIDFDGTTHTTDYTSQNPTNNYAIENTYTVELIVTTTDGCSDTITNPITIFPMPNATYSFTDTCFGIANSFTDNSTVSSGILTNWDWSFGNTNTSTLQNPTQLYANDGQYLVTLIVTTNNSCKDTITQTINVWPLPVVDFTPTSVCLNTATQFTDLSNVILGSNVAWTWNFGDATALNLSQNPMHTYATDGTFQAELFVTTNHACKDSLTKTVTVHPNPVVSFVSDSLDGCAGVIANFTDNTTINAPSDTNLFTWNWNFGNGLTSTNQNPQGIVFGNTSNTSVALYTVSLTVTAGVLYGSCSTTDTVVNMITVYPKPIADFTFSPQQTDIYDREITFMDNSIIASQLLWNLGDGDSSNVPNPIHEYADSGSYLVTLFIENIEGCKDTVQKLVKIDPVFVIFIPNAFTPEGDKLNESFSVKGYGITQLDMLIFDRWGEKIWEGHQLDDSWDGTYKGNLVENDVYVYKIKVRDVFNVWHEYIGKVTIIK